MKSSALRISLLILMTVALVMISRVSMAGTDGMDLNEIKVSIEKSPLSREKKAGLLKRASDAVNAGIPSADVAVIVKRGLARNVDSKTIEEFIGIPIAARERNLPVWPVLNRVQQGLSKGVPPEKISAFSRRLVEKLAAADNIVNGIENSGIKADKRTSREEGMQTIARALEKAIPEDTITKVGSKVAQTQASFTTFNASINTVTTFVEMGMPLESASRLVHSAMDKGYSEKEMIWMEMEMSRMMREGWMMDDAMKSIEMMKDKGSVSGMGSGTGTGMGSGMGPGMGPGMGGSGTGASDMGSGMGGMGGRR